MKYAVEMGPRAMIYSYKPSFIKIGSSIQNFLGKNTHTDSNVISKA
jgi:hypothetical protein